MLMAHDHAGLRLLLGLILLGGTAAPSFAAGQRLTVDEFKVRVYTRTTPPRTPSLDELPLLSKVTKDGITWTFAAPTRVGRFVNGDFYVVGETTVSDIAPRPTPDNARHGSMLGIQPKLERSGFDGRLESGRYDPDLRVYPPIVLRPGDQLVSSRSAESNVKAVLRPSDTSPSPVASVSILTSLAAPQPPDAFRPSYARGATRVHLSRHLNRQLLPVLRSAGTVPELGEFEGYLRRPWIDSVFFNFDVPAEYMPSYGRENGYLMSFAGLLLTLDFPVETKEPLLVYLTQYGIDLFGLVEQGHNGWQAFGGHGSGRKFPIIFAGLLLGEDRMKSVRAQFGEDQQTVWVEDIKPEGSFTRSWHRKPERAVYAGHVGIDGESVNPGWGPFEHLQPSTWKNTLGESYRRCCTSVSWVGQALAARLIPGFERAWNHPPFFAYVDRWMSTPDAPDDLQTIKQATGWTIDGDFLQGQCTRILIGGGYDRPHSRFIDAMWKAYRYRPAALLPEFRKEGAFVFRLNNLLPNSTNFVQLKTDLSSPEWLTISTIIPQTDTFLYLDPTAHLSPARFYRVGTLE